MRIVTHKIHETSINFSSEKKKVIKYPSDKQKQQIEQPK